MTHLHCDYETKSKADLPKVGLDVYSKHPSTRVLMLNWKFDDEPVRLWESHKGPLPRIVRDAFEDKEVTKIAHNAQFEIAITNEVMGIETRPEQWHCTMVMALSLGLPASLGQLAKDALQLPKEFWKDPEGDRLMKLFSMPRSKATPESHPQEWQGYCRYGGQDVVSEAKIYRILRQYVKDPQRLFREWCLDQKINANGLPVDEFFIYSAQKIADAEKARYKELLQKETGLDNPNSVKQILPWLKDRGYPFSSLAKNRVQIAMRDFADEIDGHAKHVLNLRLQSTKTSTAKFDAILRASHGGRLRNTFQFMGAAATGRYAGRILGQNMPRPWKYCEEHLKAIRKMIDECDVESLILFFDQPLECVVSSIRSAIAAPPGKKFVVADLSSIELVVIAWLTDCEFWNNVVASGKDAYKAFAEKWLGVPYDEVEKWQRTLAKPPALGCGYRMGAGRETGTYPDTEKTGLWGYAANMGVDMTKEQCREAVKIYRALSPEIKEWWTLLENAAIDCVKTREPQRVGGIVFDYLKPFLRMRLPSGRYVHYCRPRIEMVSVEYEDENTGKIKTMKKMGLTYERLSQTSKKWVRRSNHGGRFIEQAVQAIARDILQHGLHNADEMGFEIVGHYHDEILTLVDDDPFGDNPLGLDDLIHCMARDKPAWAKTMMVNAAGYEDTFYQKG